MPALRLRLFLLALAVARGPAFAADHAGGPPGLSGLLASASALGLAERPGWHALLHYRPPRLGRGVVSAADDPDFFLAPDGKRNPRAELAATLTSFFAPVSQGPDDEHPRCRFAARYRWLAEELPLGQARLPPVVCARLHDWIGALDARGMTLVFPEAFMNNPSSMFGHTLLRIDATEAPSQRDLLAYAINFAADTGGENTAIFAFKGITGLYPGYFSIAPYYQKVKEYGDWENRDIWEYRLDLSPAEIERVLLHLWELQRIRFDYFFFTENCSYQLLDLLAVARPGLRLIEGRPLWVIPVDSVRAARELVRDVSYRPSGATRLRHVARARPPEEQRTALRLARGDLEPDAEEVVSLPTAERAAVLSLAYDFLRYEYLSRRRPREDTRGRSRRMLAARSKIAVADDAGADIPAPEVRPDEGHATARVALGGGWWKDRGFVEARIRPAFHDLLDPDGGYTRGAQIVFLDTAVRVFPERGTVRLQELVVLDLLSLSGRDRFLQPVSWRFDTGLRTRFLPGDDDELHPENVWRTHGGVGLAYELAGALAYGMAVATVDLGSPLDRFHAIGPGATAGLFLPSRRDRLKGHVFAHVTPFVLGETTTEARAGIEQRVTLTGRMALALRAVWERAFGESWAHAGLEWRLYF